MGVELSERSLIIVLAYLMSIYVATAPVTLAQTQVLDKLLSMSDNDVILTYNITRSIEVINVSNLPMSYSVRQEYVVRIKALNNTHVSLQGFRFPKSTIYLTLSSSDWVGIGGLTYWIISNYTDFLAKNLLPEYNITVDKNVAVDFMNSVFILPLLRLETSSTCVNVPVADAYISGFKVVISTNLGNGNAYYDCKYGILFKAYITKTTHQRSGNTTYLIKDSVSMELYRANTKILNEIVIRERVWGIYEILIYVVPVASVSVATIMILIYVFRIKRRSPVSNQSSSG